MSPKEKSLYNNGVSYFGGLIILGTALLMLGLFAVDITSDRPNPYIGMVTYLILPGGIFAGLALILLGMRLESLRRRRSADHAARAYPKLDLNEPRQRKWFAVILVTTSLLLVMLAFAGYKGFHYTESVKFCGTVCHVVMEPEYKTYQNSAHARVPCVSCHVGEGVDWYVKAKLSGLRQVLAVIRDNYQRPIPVPIHGLRPARETCENCHWPQKFYGAIYTQVPHFRYTEQNTPEQIALNLKVGGGKPRSGQSGGIHWHMAISNEVHYTAVDPGLQQIARIRVKHSDGREDEYLSQDVKLPEGGGQPERLMDCMDCHNRPAHRVESPEEAVNKALASGLMDRTLPHIKMAAVDALVGPVGENIDPHDVMQKRLRAFYKERYPEVEAARAADLTKAANVLGDIHARNVFPKMKVTFGTYPMNIGHRSWPGCFRCHDGLHVSQKTGKVLTRDCKICHSEPVRGPWTDIGEMPKTPATDWHPFPLRGEHAKLLCHKCHAAGQNPAQTCDRCHTVRSDKSPKMTHILSCGDCHFQAEPAARTTCSNSKCHTKLGGLHETRGHDVDCVRCHPPHTFKASTEVGCRACHGSKNIEQRGPWK